MNVPRASAICSVPTMPWFGRSVAPFSNSGNGALRYRRSSGQKSRGRAALLFCQFALTAIAGATLVSPPAKGMKMLIPLTPSAARNLPALAIDGATRLVARGPLPGSLVVISDKGNAAWLLKHGVLTVSSPPAGCGGAPDAV